MLLYRPTDSQPVDGLTVCLRLLSLSSSLTSSSSFTFARVPLVFTSCSSSVSSVKFLLVKMSGVKRKRSGINVKQKLESLQKLVNGETASTDAEDVLNEGITISHSAALQSMETFLDYMGQRGFDYDDITAVRKIYVDIRQEMNKQQKQRRITDFFKAVNVKRNIPSLMLCSTQM
ncbi:hypothetical protein AVEN_40458-1 [Araneus ventricosus]|uniref:Uncharacterized protein n=1 Tax=Araneus ventricosus TaxID=182803 RepID=A0A4Y2T187_ARAVE|nr:hypothetical protein AVEN_259079-1 [Araneus ventricosus]GBN92773.1 hypothetical protein AVEN_158610-1 [Araneus ventricosus]GBN94354.1 hypothetical protein AVEN_249647-1 [Araneus ventricosus]GBN94372.1 hypothetical protein AVEN_40458-1 [Araneus ventricosus]